MEDKNTHKEDSTTIHIKKTSYEGIHESLHEVVLLKGRNCPEDSKKELTDTKLKDAC